MVGIGKLHLTADVFQVLGAQRAFDRALGADIHKYRGLHSAVGAGKLTPPGVALLLFQFKHSYLFLLGLYRTYIMVCSWVPIRVV